MQKEQQQLQQAHSSYDDAEPWHLPIGHRVEDSLDTDGIAMASTDTAIPDSNKGFQMLQKMGWKGTGLGRNENGERASLNMQVWLRAAAVHVPLGTCGQHVTHAFSTPCIIRCRCHSVSTTACSHCTMLAQVVPALS